MRDIRRTGKNRTLDHIVDIQFSAEYEIVFIEGTFEKLSNSATVVSQAAAPPDASGDGRTKVAALDRESLWRKTPKRGRLLCPFDCLGCHHCRIHCVRRARICLLHPVGVAREDAAIRR